MPLKQLYSLDTALVIANGQVPPLGRWRDLLEAEPFILCADGGARSADSFGLVPHAIIGDLDSLTKETAGRMADVPLLHQPGQDNTDMEKALDYLLENGFKKVTVLGATGGRSDHTLGNFSILRKYHDRLHISFRDAYADISLITRETQLNLAPDTTVSLIPLGSCEGVRTSGLVWNLTDETLELGVRESISNRVASRPARVSLRAGALLLFVNNSGGCDCGAS